jgi:DNA invertase Pin-like site-specific DNA recombinase
METSPRRRRRIDPSAPLAAYIRVSSASQAESGISLDGQRSTIAEYAASNSLPIGTWYEDAAVSGGKRARSRPGLRAALEAIESGHAGGLIVAKIDRLGRSAEAITLCEDAARGGWQVVVVDLGLDTTTESGEAVLWAFSMVARMELRRASTRMRDFHAERRRQGLRRRDAVPVEIADRMISMRSKGLSYESIGQALDADNIPTASGGKRWWPMTVRSAVLARSRELADQTESA